MLVELSLQRFWVVSYMLLYKHNQSALELIVLKLV